MASNIIQSLGYEGPDTEEMSMYLRKLVFKTWLDHTDNMAVKREEERKTSLRRWDRDLWVLKKRDGRQRRLQQEREAIQHCWPPRGAPFSTFQTRHVLPGLNLPSRPATCRQQDAWSLEAEAAQRSCSARECGSERRRALQQMYLPPSPSGKKSHSARGVVDRRTMENIMFERTILTRVLDGV
jgi:hypothetical protein